jgi:hypothetical protein
VPGRHTPVACALLVAALATAPVVLAQAPSGTRKAAPPPKAGPSKAAASPAAFDALVKDAAAAREAGRLDDAIALYRKAVRQKPDWIEGHWYIGPRSTSAGSTTARSRRSLRSWARSR